MRVINTCAPCSHTIFENVKSVGHIHHNDKLSLNCCLATLQQSKTSNGICCNKPLHHYSIFCLHLVSKETYFALQEWGIQRDAKYLSSVHYQQPLFSDGSFCLTFSFELSSCLTVILPLSVTSPNLPASLSPPVCVTVCVRARHFLFLSFSVSILFTWLPQNGGWVKKIIPWFSAERQQVKIEKVTFHVQFSKNVWDFPKMIK